MFSQTRPDASENPLAGIPDRQIEALAERFGNGPRLTPFRTVGLRLGCKKESAFRLVTRGLKNLAANGWAPANPPTATHRAH
jgi:hypothetical protein